MAKRQREETDTAPVAPAEAGGMVAATSEAIDGTEVPAAAEPEGSEPPAAEPKRSEPPAAADELTQLHYDGEVDAHFPIRNDDGSYTYVTGIRGKLTAPIARQHAELLVAAKKGFRWPE